MLATSSMDLIFFPSRASLNFDVPEGRRHDFSGQGAMRIPAIICGISFRGGPRSATNLLSDESRTDPITLIRNSGHLGARERRNGPRRLQQPTNITVQCAGRILSKRSCGTYDLYPYGINNTGDAGDDFTVSRSNGGRHREHGKYAGKLNQPYAGD